VVPGIVNSFIAWSARAMPYEILLPMVDWLMKPRMRPVPGAEISRRRRLKAASASGTSASRGG
jgi:hypothetical protein